MRLALRDLVYMVESGVAIRLPLWLHPTRNGWRFGVGCYLFDPIPVWECVRQPVLAIWGAADAVVPARGSARVIERALRRAGTVRLPSDCSQAAVTYRSSSQMAILRS